MILEEIKFEDLEEGNDYLVEVSRYDTWEVLSLDQGKLKTIGDNFIIERSDCRRFFILSKVMQK